MTAGLPPLPPLDSLQPDASSPLDDTREREAVREFIKATHERGESVGGLCLKKGTGPDRCDNPAAFGSRFCNSCEALSRKRLRKAPGANGELVPVPGPIRMGTGTSSGSASEPTTLRIATLDEMRQRPKPEFRWLVDGLLPLNGLAIIGAPSKCGKSTLARNLAHVVCAGEGDWMGRTCRSGPVLHLPLEEGASTVIGHYDKLRTPGDRIHVLDQPQPAPANRAGLLENTIRETEARLVIIDTLAKWIRLAPKQGNDYFAVSEVMDPYVGMSRELGACLLFVHHNRKGGGANGEEILGSVALAGAFDTILSMRWAAGKRTLYGFGRDDAALEDIVLGYDKETGRVWQACTKVEADKAGIEERVMEYLSDEGGWVDNKTIKTSVKGKRNYIVHALKNLLETGIVTSKKKEGRGGAIQYCLSELVPVPGPIRMGTGTSLEPPLFGEAA